MVLLAYLIQSGIAELLATSDSHAQCLISRQAAGLFYHQASHSTLLTKTIQMLSLLKEPEVTLEAWSRKPTFRNGTSFILLPLNQENFS